MTLENRIRPPYVMVIAATLTLFVDHLIGVSPAGPMRWWAAAGLVVLGATSAAAGLATFHRAHTTHDPLRPERASALVTHGIYAWTRNPMYVGLTLVLAGIGVWSGGGAGFALVPAFVAYIDRYQIGPEERALRAKFGDDAFETYRSRVRRWI